MKTIRIGVLLEADIYHVRGEYAAVHSRIKALQHDSRFEIDAFVLWPYFDRLTTALRRFPVSDRPSEFTLDGFRYHCGWYRRSYGDYIAKKLIGKSLGRESETVRRLCSYINDYDIIWANSLNTALACMNNNVPFIVTWHGSSIHTDPFKDKRVFKMTRKVLSDAAMNLFVSDELMRIARSITPFFNGTVSYNGVDTEVFSPVGREQHQGKNIIYAGNYLPVKNVRFLPVLFENIAAHVPDAHFIIIGNGDFQKDFSKSDIDVTFMGNVERERMPDIFRESDLAVLPSLHEGLPMVCLEATACGCPMVATRVGAIADVIGKEQTVPKGDSFELDFCKLCVDTLLSAPKVQLPSKFDLPNVIKRESDMIVSLLQ